MAIWSLTNERVEKLLKQIGDKQTEIDELIKLSKEDIWNKDLDDFMEEWNFQLADDIARRKQIQGMKRRVSSKLRTQTKPARKRKGDDTDDSDFGTKKQKKASAAAKKNDGGLLGYLQKQSPPKKVEKKAEEPKLAEKDVWMSLEGMSDSEAAVIPKPKAKTVPIKPPAPVKSSKPKQEDSDDEPIIPAPSRGGRAAARKPVNYGLGSDSDMESDGDFDVSRMVKGIGESTSTSAVPSRPLFSATLSRPGSSAGLVARKSLGTRGDRTVADGDSDDETDYTRLAPASNGTKIATTANATVLSEDDSMDMGMLAPAPAPVATAPPPKKRGRKPAAEAAAAPKAKPAPKATAAPKPTKAMAPKPAEKKQTTLSPAAKAYATKQGNKVGKSSSAATTAKKRVLSDDDDDDDDEDMDAAESEVEKMANEMLSDDDDDEKPVIRRPAVAATTTGRPARKAATQTKKAWGVESSEEEEEDEDESLGFDEGDDDSE